MVCSAPIDGPATSARRFTPRWSSSRFCTSTKSRIVTTGKFIAKGRPVEGSTVAGPVVWVRGSRAVRFTGVSDATTKYRSVSIALPEPMIASHQPAGPSAS